MSAQPAAPAPAPAPAQYEAPAAPVQPSAPVKQYAGASLPETGGISPVALASVALAFVVVIGAVALRRRA